jgi:stress response protein YsnF
MTQQDDQHRPPAAERHEKVVVPVVNEQIRIENELREKGITAVHIVPHLRQEVVDVPVAEQEVVVKRVPVNRIVDAPAPVRQEGSVTIVPVYEEVLVVEKRLRLKEEVHLICRTHQKQERREVQLRDEQVNILRSNEPGQSE